MKDALGHGSDARGGDSGPAHQQGIQRATTPMQRRQYEAIAGAINTFGDSHPEVHSELARTFANGLQGTNPHYDRDKFQTAAMTGDMGTTRSRAGSVATGMQRRHYETVANTLNSFGRDHPDIRDDLANHFAHQLGRNPNFDSDRFIKAAGGTPARDFSGRTAFRH